MHRTHLASRRSLRAGGRRAGAATCTVLDRLASGIAREQLGEVAHEPGCDVIADGSADCSCGELDRARRAAGLRPDQLRVFCKRVGGGFGGKQEMITEDLAALAALDSGGRPVCLEYTRTEEFTTASPPHAPSATIPKPTSSIHGANFMLQKNNPADDLSRSNCQVPAARHE